MCRSFKAFHGGRETLPAQNEQVDDVADQSEDADADDDDSVQRVLDDFGHAKPRVLRDFGRARPRVVGVGRPRR